MTARPKKKKKSTKKAATKKAVEVMPDEISEMPDLSALKKRMLHFWKCSAVELNRVANDPLTPMHDLIILRMLKDMRDHGNLQTTVFYLDVIYGGAKVLGGITGDDGGNGSPVTLFTIPSNGSEAIDIER